MNRTHKEQRDQRDTAEQDRMSGIIVLKKCRFRNSKWHCHTTCGLLFLVFWLWLGKKTTVWEFKAHAVMWELFSLFSSALAPSLGFLWSCTEPKENIHHLKIRDQIVQRNCSSKGDLSRMFAKKKMFWRKTYSATKHLMAAKAYTNKDNNGRGKWALDSWVKRIQEYIPGFAIWDT